MRTKVKVDIGSGVKGKNIYTEKVEGKSWGIISILIQFLCDKRKF